MAKTMAQPTIYFGTMTGVDIKDLESFVSELLRVPMGDAVESLRELGRQLDIAHYDGLEALDHDLSVGRGNHYDGTK